MVGDMNLWGVTSPDNINIGELRRSLEDIGVRPDFIQINRRGSRGGAYKRSSGRKMRGGNKVVMGFPLNQGKPDIPKDLIPGATIKDIRDEPIRVYNEGNGAQGSDNSMELVTETSFPVKDRPNAYRVNNVPKEVNLVVTDNDTPADPEEITYKNGIYTLCAARGENMTKIICATAAGSEMDPIGPRSVVMQKLKKAFSLLNPTISKNTTPEEINKIAAKLAAKLSTGIDGLIGAKGEVAMYVNSCSNLEGEAKRECEKNAKKLQESVNHLSNAEDAVSQVAM